MKFSLTLVPGETPNWPTFPRENRGQTRIFTSSELQRVVNIIIIIT